MPSTASCAFWSIRCIAASPWYRRCRRRRDCPACRRAPPARPVRATASRAPHRVRRIVQLHREVLLRVRDRRRAERSHRFHGAIAEHRHAAVGEIGHREAGGEGQHGAVLLLQPRQLLVDGLAGLDERALRRDAGEVVELVEAALRRSAGAKHLIEQRARRARRSRPCRRADRCGRRPARRRARPSRASRWRAGRGSRRPARARPPSRARAAGSRPRRRRRSPPPSRRAGRDRRRRPEALASAWKSIPQRSFRKRRAVTCADGLAAPHAVPTRLCPSARSAWIAPAAGMLAPSTAPKMGSPYCTPGQPPPASNAA